MPPRCQLLSASLSTSRTAFIGPQPTQRGFSSSSALYKNPLARRRGGDLGKHLPKYVIPQDADIPEYPYGPNLLYKQSNKGLYGKQMIRFGNNVSRKTETTTRRDWKPNVLSKSLYSVALKKRIHLRITAKVLKIIDNEGGLDEYLLKPSEARIKELGPMGWALRWTLLQKPEIVQRMRDEAAGLGLTQEQIDRQWPIPQAGAFEAALKKTERMQEADSMDSIEDYVESTVGEELGRLGGTEAAASNETSEAGGDKDAWAALIETTKPSSETRRQA